MALAHLEPVDLQDFMMRSSCRNTREFYLDRLQRILGAFPHSAGYTVPHQPSQILLGIFLGTTADAENEELLRRLEITHIVNCSAPRKVSLPAAKYDSVMGLRLGNSRRATPVAHRNKRPYGIQGYLGLGAEDTEYFDIRSLFTLTNDYVKRARTSGGRVLICCQGTNLSATVYLAFMISIKSMYLLEAAKLVKDCRRVALGNVHFMNELVNLAADEGLLDPKPRKVLAPTFGTDRDRHRLMGVHLPDIRIV